MRMYLSLTTLPPHEYMDVLPPIVFTSVMRHCQGQECSRASTPPTMRVIVTQGSTAGLPQVTSLGGGPFVSTDTDRKNNECDSYREILWIAKMNYTHRYKLTSDKCPAQRKASCAVGIVRLEDNQHG